MFGPSFECSFSPLSAEKIKEQFSPFDHIQSCSAVPRAEIHLLLTSTPNAYVPITNKHLISHNQLSSLLLHILLSSTALKAHITSMLLPKLLTIHFMHSRKAKQEPFDPLSNVKLWTQFMLTSLVDYEKSSWRFMTKAITPT